MNLCTQRCNAWLFCKAQNGANRKTEKIKSKRQRKKNPYQALTEHLFIFFLLLFCFIIFCIFLLVLAFRPSAHTICCWLLLHSPVTCCSSTINIQRKRKADQEQAEKKKQQQIFFFFYSAHISSFRIAFRTFMAIVKKAQLSVYRLVKHSSFDFVSSFLFLSKKNNTSDTNCASVEKHEQ